MPGKVKVRVLAGRGLPVMDRSTDLTDAYVEVRFGTDVFKTDICKKSLNPQWNSEWFKFEVEDESLQDEPLELRVLDHDTYSANDAIGKIYVDLNPLLTKDPLKVISGWFPIYDTMHGIRGELNIIVKVDLFSDVNKFRQSSCGIQFFSTAEVPSGYRMQVINGFVEELVVNDDPEYQWIDKIRTPRASNEARQRLFSKLSGSSLTESSGSGSGLGSGGKAVTKLSAQQPSIELMEYPFFTMTSFPVGFIIHLGGVVSAKSVKLLDKIHNPEEPETRDAWWTEIRTEIRTHCRTMGCHAVLGYTEHTTICDEIIVLCATGTAARVNVTYDPASSTRIPPPAPAVVQEKPSTEKERDKKLYVDVNLANSAAQGSLHALYDHSSDDGAPFYNCLLCHVPYKPNSAPFPVNLSVCAICRKRKVPDVLFTTIDPPQEIQTHGKGAFLQARVCRPKPKSKGGESNAKEISDCLPFLEYELHSQLMNKLKLFGMNGLYGLKMQITVGESLLVGVATATAVFIAALPIPPIPRVSGQDTGQASPRSIVTDDSDDDASDLDLSSGNKETFVIEVDDANDENIVALLRESQLPEGFTMLNTHKIPGSTSLAANLQMFTQVWRQEYFPTSRSSFMDIFENLVKKICYKLRRMSPCCLCGIDFGVDIPEEKEIQITLTGVCCSTENVPDSVFELQSTNKGNLLKTAPLLRQTKVETTGTKMEGNTRRSLEHVHVHNIHKLKSWVELTPLHYIPGFKIERYLGNYNFFFIRESTSLREVGGQGGFMQMFVAEVMANVRANVASLGGNGLVSYRMNQCVLMCNPHKNQSQCLINVSGDAVVVAPEESFPIVVEPLRKNSDSPVT
uniref:Uncharacterized protein n=1 Tax=Magallana gigas TaxID=29159 RepID=K1RIN0_MAGGI